MKHCIYQFRFKCVNRTYSHGTVKKWLATALLLLVGITASAASIDETTALATATRFLQDKVDVKMRGAAPVTLHLVGTRISAVNADVADYYVYTTDDGCAFVIVAGDDRAQEVLAYGDTGLDMNRIPKAMQWMLDRYAAQLEYLQAHPEISADANLRSSGKGLTVAPLVTCQWDQGTPYNNRCPNDQGTRCATGCGATAMAQVMYRWKFPAVAPELPAYVTRTAQLNMPALPSIPLDWDNMLDSYKNVNYTADQADAVAWLMLYCGQACYMDYSANASDARDMEYMLTAMMTLGYHATSAERAQYSYDDWNAMMMEEMEAGRPILYHAKVSPTSGHVFVVDGCDDGKYHINWGWSGSGDGYFELDAFVVGNYSFTLDQMMAYQIAPNESGEPIQAYDVAIDGIYYRIDGDEAVVVNKDSRFNSYRGDVTIPDQITVDGRTLAVTSIGNSAFRNCDELTHVTLGNAVETIGNSAFLNATALTGVTMGNALTTIGPNAFAGCTALTNVTLPSSVKEIKMSAFESCHNLLGVTTSSPSLVIGNFAFAYCSKLAKATFVNGDLNIGEYAFMGCQSLGLLTFGDGQTTIGTWSFYNCSSLRTVTFGNGAKVIGYAAFGYCSGLTTVNFGTGDLSFDSFCFYGTGLTTVNITDVKSWCTATFTDANSNPLNITHSLSLNGKPVKELVIDDDVEFISDYAFYGCTPLTSVTMGKAMTSVGARAFTGCNVIKTVTCLAVTPPALNTKNAFNNTVYTSATLNVPLRSLEQYSSTAYWSSFKNIVGIDTGDMPGDVNGDGAISISDVTALIQMLLDGTSSTAADVDGSGNVNIEDVTALITQLLNKN